MHLDTQSLFLTALCAAYAKPACAAQRRQYQPIMLNGAVAAQEVEVGDEAMIESIMSIPLPGPARHAAAGIDHVALPPVPTPVIEQHAMDEGSLSSSSSSSSATTTSLSPSSLTPSTAAVTSTTLTTAIVSATQTTAITSTSILTSTEAITPATTSAPATPPKAEDIGAGNGAVTIHKPQQAQGQDKAAAATATVPAVPIPINIKMFAGSEGPSDCKGRVMVNMDVPKPGPVTAPVCYNMPALSECAVFTANKEDGCEARLFNSANCLSETFANLAVFMEEYRPIGGMFRSIEVQCGIVGVEPPPLNLPGLQMPVPGKKGGKKR